MNRYNMVVAAVALAALSGCATPPTPPAAEQPDDKAYVTGSRIPVRDNSTSADVKGISDKRSIDDMVRPSGYIGPKSN